MEVRLSWLWAFAALALGCAKFSAAEGPTPTPDASADGGGEVAVERDVVVVADWPTLSALDPTNDSRAAILRITIVDTNDTSRRAVKKLAAQGIGCLLLAPFAVQLVALSESRWSAIRVVTESAILWFSAIWVAVIRTFDEFDTSRPFTWVFLAFLAAEWLLATWLYLGLEARRRARRAGPIVAT